MARRPPSGPFVLPLSGGRDSRHILFALNDAGHRPDACVTVRHFPPRANDDELVAQEVCATLALEHRVIVQGRERHVLEREKNRATHLCTDEHAQFVVLADYLRVHTPETYDGIGGDVLSQSTYLQPDVHALFRRGDTAGVAAYVLDGYGITMSERALARVLQPAFYREIPRERAVTRLIAEIAGHLDAPNPIGSFFFANRTRREIALAPYALLRDVTVYAPYLDSDLYDFLASLPADLLMDRSLHTDAIARAWPQWAAIPYERKGLRTEDRWGQRRAARAVLRAAWRHSSRRYVRRGTLVPMMLTTIADGAADRLWPASLVWYLDQIADVTAAPIAASARER